ncbi:killer suppression protein HigA [Candidatus Woesearchaeota archaeon]|jgi:plasmid maintenance system killer protein|nr:killer suppression protein HigA [Candidatus Woesearchaeota archaeon]MBT7555373.1 killer suppression protein HigA [Candidatus Woesearchaeota archaeon]
MVKDKRHFQQNTLQIGFKYFIYLHLSNYFDIIYYQFGNVFYILDIDFHTKKLKNNCEKEAKAIKGYGANYAKCLFKRLAQLRAADKLGDFYFDSPHPLSGNKIGKFAITIQGKLRLVFESQKPTPKTKDGAIDWDNVTGIKITSIEDYH